MKQFFKTFFAALLAFITGSGCMVLIAFSMITATIAGLATLGDSSSSEPATLSNGTILKVDISSLDETVIEDPLVGIFGDASAQPIALTTAVRTIREAKNNPNIDAIYLNTDGLGASIANIEEVRRALIDFKASGKKVIAYADDYGQQAYYLASVADRIILNPLGGVGLVGIATGNLMMSSALEKLGVEMMVFRVGTFKSAVEPFIQDKMSDANRLQTQQYIDGVWETILSGISEARGLSIEHLTDFAESGAALSYGDSPLKYGLVDTLAYREDVESIIAGLLDRDKDDLKMITLQDMTAHITEHNTTSDHKIRVVYAEGDIAQVDANVYTSQEKHIDYSLAKQLQELATDDDVDAVVLRINSPGGSAFISEQIWQSMVRLTKIKPVVVSMGSMAASGGYYIAAPASMIVAEPTTLTGSIGIFGMVPNVSQLAKKVGLNMDVVKTNTYADITLSMPMSPANEDHKRAIQRLVERGYETFLDRVAQGRQMTPEQVDSVGQGRIWLGKQALALGLVDKLGGLDTAIEEAARLAELDDYQIDYGQTSRSIFDTLFEGITQSDQFVARLRSAMLTPEERTLMEVLSTATHRSGVQARLPYGITAY